MYLNAAGNDAGAATIVVYSMAPASSRDACTCAIVEPFWPMATYTHLTAFFLSPLFQLSRWLMIVSSSTAVLPVCRSPMMSWRWPRPIGVIASIALIPVWSGSFTGWRCTTDGACSSSGRVSVVSISPLPSSGRPNGSTTRPRKPSPTGTERMLPVRRTSWPSSMCWESPRMTQPISRTSRLSAMPSTPPSNSSSSLVMHECRPSTRAMPSPVSVTTPTSSRDAPASYDDTMLSSASRISSGRIVNSVMGRAPSLASWCLLGCCLGAASCSPGLAAELPAGLGQVADHAAVDLLVADPDRDTADEGRVHDQLEPDVLPDGGPQRLGEPLLLVLGQCDGRRHPGDEALPARRRELGVVTENPLEGPPPRGDDRALHQRERHLGDLVVEQPVEQLELAVGRQQPVGERRAELVLRGEDALEPEQPVLDLVELVVALGADESDLDGKVLEPVDHVARLGPTTAGDLLQQLDGGRRDPLAEQRVDELLLARRVDGRVRQRPTHATGAGEDRDDREQLVGQLLEPTAVQVPGQLGETVPQRAERSAACALH